MKTIYISIPMAGKCIEKQRAKADHWQKHFEGLNYRVINPFLLCDHLELIHKERGRSAPTETEYLTHDLHEMQDADSIFLCDGWHNSRGCMKEAHKSIECDMKPVFERTYWE